MSEEEQHHESDAASEANDARSDGGELSANEDTATEAQSSLTGATKTGLSNDKEGKKKEVEEDVPKSFPQKVSVMGCL